MRSAPSAAGDDARASNPAAIRRTPIRRPRLACTVIPSSRDSASIAPLADTLTERFLQAAESLVQRVRLDRLLADRACVGDRAAVAHHVDASLAGPEEAGPGDLDAGVDALIGSVCAEHADRWKAALAPNLLGLQASLVDRLIERVELLPSDIGPMPDRDLP